MKPKENPKTWPKAEAMQPQVTNAAASCIQQPVTHGVTATMARRGEFQNMLIAVPHPHKKTGYKDCSDPCNRADKHNGGEYRRFASAYSSDYAAIEDRTIQFREDGLPISGRKVPGKPLMAPNLPNAADCSIAKRLMKKYNHQSSITFGNPNKDARRFRSVYSIVHHAPSPHRQLGQPNPGIAAEDAARAHKELGLFI